MATTGLVSSQIDDAKLQRELLIRGIDARRLAKKAGVSEATLARGRHGHRPRPSTLLAIAVALKSFAVLPNVAAILPDAPTSNGHSEEPVKHDVPAAPRDSARTSKEEQRVAARRTSGRKA